MIGGKKIKIAVGMSGGVDSTIAAFLLKQKGYDVTGITMRIWPGEYSCQTSRSGCYGPGEAQDIRDAANAAKKLGIPHYVIDLRKEYQEHVFEYFKHEYAKGKTPNPCIVCNAKIKFDLLLKKAFDLGIDFDYFATGHYARVSYDPGKSIFILKRGADKSKDQSYFLYLLKQNQLKKILLPLGSKKKDEVKEIAKKNGFKDYAKKEESQNFVECDDYFSILPRGIPGAIMDYKGNVLGNHEGITHYTIGQRRNLKIGGLKEPYYVLRIDARKNSIIVGPKEFAYSKEARVEKVNWIIPFEFAKNKKIKAKIRYGAPLAECTVSLNPGKKAVIKFKESQFAVTKGQSAVLYDNDIVLGGGIIY